MIKLTAVSYNNQAAPAPLSAVFGRDGGTLGRSDDNHFVLPDPKNLVSRVQALVKSDGSRHSITNLSQANPILLNGKEIDFDREFPFNPGDEIQVGLYVLRAEPHLVAVEGNPAAPAATSTESHAVPLKAAQAPRDPVAGTIGSARQVPNLAELHQKKTEASAIRARLADESAHPPVKEKPPATSAEQATPDAAAGDHDVLMQAFLKGAGLADVSLNADVTPEFMETIGKLLATSIHGTFELLATRSSIKREVKADVTMVVVRNNNPLKFLSDSETVLVQMLRKKMPGFMGPNEALQDAFADLHAHQSGMVAGMNGAIHEVLKRFDPKALEERVKAPNLLDSVVPSHRKARMWDLYDQLYEEINREAQRDYQKLFGKAFLKAYEKEIARSRNEENDA